MDHQQVDYEFIKRWDLNSDKLQKKQSAFMSEIRHLLWLLSHDPHSGDSDITNAMDSSYDSSSILEHIAQMIEQYNLIFHILHTSNHYAEEYSKKQKQEAS